MKVKIAIEEIISQTFEVEVSDLDNAYDEIRNRYRKGELVVTDPSLTQANVNISDKNGEWTNWLDLHVN